MVTVRQERFDEFFSRRLPDDGFTLEEVYNDYLWLIEETNGSRLEPEIYLPSKERREASHLDPVESE